MVEYFPLFGLTHLPLMSNSYCGTWALAFIGNLRRKDFIILLNVDVNYSFIPIVLPQGNFLWLNENCFHELYLRKKIPAEHSNFSGAVSDRRRI